MAGNAMTGAAATTTSSSPSSSTALGPPRPPQDPASLLTSLKSLGLATEISVSDLALTSTTTTTSNGISSTYPSSSSSSSSSSSNLSLLLPRLSLLLSDLTRLLTTHITTHLSSLLGAAARVEELQRSLRDVRRSVAELEASFEGRCRAQLVGARRRLERDEKRLRRLNEVVEVGRGAKRFVGEARRLEGCLRVLFGEEQEQEQEQEGEGAANAPTSSRSSPSSPAQQDALTHACQHLSNISRLLSTTSPQLKRLSFVASYTPSILGTARSQLQDRIESSIVTALRDLDGRLLASSLLAAERLGVRRDLIADLMGDLIDVVKKRADAAFDGSAAGGAGGGGGASSSSSSLAGRLEHLLTVEMAAVCSKIYLLQRVLGLMHVDDGEGQREEQDKAEEATTTATTKDSAAAAATGAAPAPRTLLDESLVLLGDAPTLLFWRTLASSIAANSSTAAPPSHGKAVGAQARREIRGFVDVFFERTSVWTGLQHGAGAAGAGGGGPERTLLLRSLGGLAAA